MFNKLNTSICILCHANTQQALCLCTNCLNDLPSIKNCCSQCGNTLPAEVADLCGSCQANPPPIDKTFSLFHYKTPIDHLIKQLKFKHSFVTADLLGKLMAEAIIQRGITLPEAIIPTPLHYKRLRMRGYNQSIEIAKPLAKHLKLPLLNTDLIRNKHIRPQTECSAKERRRNLRNNFICRTPLSYATIAVVDDVITTGTTVNEIAKTLKKKGVKEVYAWSCAHSSML
ncbi:MAG: ComF family protein [Thiotrichaceae bacterium]